MPRLFIDPAATPLCAGAALALPAAAARHVQVLRLQPGAAVTLFDGRRGASRLNISRVRFAPIPRAEIDAYVASGEPFGKAGGYAIQSEAARWIEHIDGSYSGIMGLPLFETAQLLKGLARLDANTARR